jgi:SpoVK/Ycf46/Vps4 family AAA+-type ATPase
MAERVQYTQWLKRSNNTFYPTDNSKTQDMLDSGIYNICFNPDQGYYLLKKEMNLDELIQLPSPEAQLAIDLIKFFWTRRDKFKEYNYAYKRGILLYGVPGGGKTSIINLLCKHLTEDLNGVVFTLTNDDDLGRYSKFMPEVYRVIEKDRPIITIIEDIDGLCQNKETETKLINLLDGLEQLENIVYLATTNYTERLSERIMNRPNRFDRRIEVKSPNAECRRIYFEKKLKPADLAEIDIENWVTQTERMTMAQLGEVIKSVIILGDTFDDTVKRLTGMATPLNSRNYNKDFEEAFGFAGRKNN